jgi:hypothetical protein
MAGVKLVVIYPRPKDIEVFENLYQEEHVLRPVRRSICRQTAQRLSCGQVFWVSHGCLSSRRGHPRIGPAPGQTAA